MDQETETRVYANLFAHFADAVVIFSIRRLHLLDRFARVIFLSKGRLAGCGSKAELPERSEEFCLFPAGQTGAGVGISG